jgi:hypothetical protein
VHVFVCLCVFLHVFAWAPVCECMCAVRLTWSSRRLGRQAPSSTKGCTGLHRLVQLHRLPCPVHAVHRVPVSVEAGEHTHHILNTSQTGSTGSECLAWVKSSRTTSVPNRLQKAAKKYNSKQRGRVHSSVRKDISTPDRIPRLEVRLLSLGLGGQRRVDGTTQVAGLNPGLLLPGRSAELGVCVVRG